MSQRVWIILAILIINQLQEQKMNRLIKSLVIGMICMPYMLAMAATKSDEVVLNVLDPRGEIPPPPFNVPADRVTNLDGKTVGIYWIGKAGGNNFWDGVEDLMHKRFPKTKIKRYQGPFDLGAERAAKIAKEVDTMFYGVGD